MNGRNPPPLPWQPRDEEGPTFREAWEAQAFAMTMSLHQNGVFTWTEWAATLADEIKRAQAKGDPDLGTTYYHHWLEALERLVILKGAATSASLHQTAHAWEEAARNTPHGKPILLGAHGEHLASLYDTGIILPRTEKD